jgi:type II secretory pathway component PulJ
VVVQWDANSNGRWETSPASDADQTGFRLQNGVLETLRGATSCEGKGWDKMTDPNTVNITLFRLPGSKPRALRLSLPSVLQAKSKAEHRTFLLPLA